MANSVSRIEARRAAVLEEILEHAVAVMSEQGVGALSLSEVARRMGMRTPSLYKHVASLQDLRDALFTRALHDSLAAVETAITVAEEGWPRIRAGAEAVVRWAVAHPASAQLLYWRTVPSYEPSAEAVRPGRDDAEKLREELRTAVRLGHLSPAADSAEAARLYTVLLSGVISQHLANQPHRSFGRGDYTRLLPAALDMFAARYHPRSDHDADPRP